MNDRKIGYFFIVFASIVIVLAGIKVASSIVIPFLLSVFIAIILSPLYNYFKSKGMPNGLSLAVVTTIFVVFIILIVKLVGNSVQEFSANIGMYEEKLASIFHHISVVLLDMGIVVSEHEMSSIINPKQIMNFSSGVVQGLGSMFTNGFIILLSVVFMLLESEYFVKKIESITTNVSVIKNIEDILFNIKRYMVIKAVISLLTGVFIWLSLLYIGTDYAFLWGVMAFMLNFIPNIGSIIAAVPAVLLTLIQLGYGSAFVVGIIYMFVNIIVGSVVEPKIMGKGLGLSTLVVFLSLIFWGWLLGIVGMLLSIPLTMIIKIILDGSDNTRWIAVLLGTGEDLVKPKSEIQDKN